MSDNLAWAYGEGYKKGQAEALKGADVNLQQVEAVMQQFYDVVEPDYFDDRPEEVRNGYVEVLRMAMVNAGIRVVSAANAASSAASPKDSSSDSGSTSRRGEEG